MKYNYYCSVDLDQHKRGIVLCLIDDLKKVIKWTWRNIRREL